jgi:hypothetical protein
MSPFKPVINTTSLMQTLLLSVSGMVEPSFDASIEQHMNNAADLSVLNNT